MDLVSYNIKNNGAVWPFGPSDGGNDDNFSWDSGEITPSALASAQHLTVQFVSRGVR